MAQSLADYSRNVCKVLHSANAVITRLPGSEQKSAKIGAVPEIYFHCFHVIWSCWC